MLKIKKQFRFIVLGAALIGIYVACTAVINSSKYPLEVIPKGPTTQTWTGDDGRIYTMQWEASPSIYAKEVK